MSDTRVPANVLVAHLDGEAVLLHMDSKRYYRLNETGQRVWRLLERGLERGAIVETLVAEYDVDAATAGTELDRVIEELKRHALLERPGGEGADAC